jgi:hypothetical protein
MIKFPVIKIHKHLCSCGIHLIDISKLVKNIQVPWIQFIADHHDYIWLYLLNNMFPIVMQNVVLNGCDGCFCWIIFDSIRFTIIISFTVAVTMTNYQYSSCHYYNLNCYYSRHQLNITVKGTSYTIFTIAWLHIHRILFFIFTNIISIPSSINSTISC